MADSGPRPEKVEGGESKIARGHDNIARSGALHEAVNDQSGALALAAPACPPALRLKFRRQHPIGPYIADFACLQCRLVVELDGASHSTDQEIAHDRRRTAFIERDGWLVLRFWNTDLYDDIDETLNRIAEVASARTSSAQRVR